MWITGNGSVFISISIIRVYFIKTVYIKLLLMNSFLRNDLLNRKITILGITLWPPAWPVDFVFMTATSLAKLSLPSNARLLFVMQNLRVSDLVSTCDVWIITWPHTCLTFTSNNEPTSAYLFREVKYFNFFSSRSQSAVHRTNIYRGIWLSRVGSAVTWRSAGL
jgi:hypothetical protein